MNNNLITVILADENSNLRMQIAEELKSRGNIHVIASVSNGIDLVEKATNYMPDVIITDSILPKLDGLCAIKTLSKINKKTKTIVISSFLSPNVTAECSELNVNHFVLKPFNIENLVDKVESCVNLYDFKMV